jgi:hypothetical protein
LIQSLAHGARDVKETVVDLRPEDRVDFAGRRRYTPHRPPCRERAAVPFGAHVSVMSTWRGGDAGVRCSDSVVRRKEMTMDDRLWGKREEDEEEEEDWEDEDEEDEDDDFDYEDEDDEDWEDEEDEG